MFTKFKDSVINLTSKFNHFYLIPLFGLVCWYTLCFVLVGLWVGDGARAYPEFQEYAKPLPLERIGAILAPGFFLTFVVIHSIVFCVSLYLEFYHRKIGKLIKFIRPTLQKRLAWASIIFGIIAQLFFIAQASVSYIFINKNLRRINHYAELLATFAVLVMISLALNFTNYYIMGQYYRKYVNGERWNKFTISFVLKITWLVITIILAVTCAAFYAKGHKSVADIIEWTFHFWYGLLMAFWTYDLYPLTELRALKRGEAEPKKQRSFFGLKFGGEKNAIVTSTSVDNSSLTPSDSNESYGDLDASPMGFEGAGFDPINSTPNLDEQRHI